MNNYSNTSGDMVLTFNGNVNVGDIVSIDADMTVSKSVADKDIIGVCVSKRDNTVGVKLRGIVKCKYTSNAPALGYVTLVTAGNNEIKASVSGVKYLVLDVDTASSTATILM